MPSKLSGGLGEAVPSAERGKYAWLERSTTSTRLEDFLSNYPPATTHRASGSDGWIWVCSKRAPDGEERRSHGKESGKEKEDAQLHAVERASKILLDLESRLEEIEANDKIPKIKSKTSGPSKRMMREAAVSEAERQLRNCGEELKTGKWLFFERPEYANLVFSTLAESIIRGPLSRLNRASCHTVKVAMADSRGGGYRGREGESQHLICLYFDDIWNKEDALQVLTCIVQEHGVIPNSAKPDLYTYIGLDSNHPSKIRSTLYRPGELVNYDILREWQDDFRAGERRKHSAVSKPSWRPSASKDGMSSLPEPIDPAVFWPEVVVDEADFEEVPGEAKLKGTPKNDANVVTVCDSKTKGPTSAPKKVVGSPKDGVAIDTPKQPVSSAALDDSETESESDTEWRRRFKPVSAAKASPKMESTHETKGKAATTSLQDPPMSPVSKKVKTNESCALDSSSIQTFSDEHKERTPSTSPRLNKEKVKSTPIIKHSRQQTRKRDRFGRDDF